MPNKIAPLHELLSKLRLYFQETTTTRKYADEQPPLRAELYNIAQIEHYGMQLAKSHKTIMGRAANSLLARLAENDKILHEVRDLLIEAIHDQQMVTPAGEWLLDNFYLIEEHISTGKQHLPKGYSEGLPRLANGVSIGLPRVYDIALEVIAHSDGRIDIHNLSRFIQAYQKVTTLKIGELWAIPIMLRLALIENLRRVAARIAVDRINQKLADHWSDLMIETSEKDPKSLILVIADMARSGPPMESSFVAELTRQLMWKGPSLTLPLTWMEQRLSEQGITATSLIDIENQKQAADQVSISNTISSLRFVNTMDWRSFVEDLSIVESTLRSEKSGVYPMMDFATRDQYRHIIEHIAKFSPLSETEIADIAIQQANKVADEKSPSDKKAHVGYYLVDNALAQTEALAKMQLPLNVKITRFFKGKPLAVFAGSVTILSLLVTLALTYREYEDGAALWLAITLSVFTLIASSQLVISLVNWVATLLVKPHPLARLDLSKEIPDEYKTLVAIPTMITNEDNISSLIDGMEIRYLANCKKNIFFALLTDFADADRETTPLDEKLLDFAGSKIQELNNKYGEGTDIFFLFHRPRKWNKYDKVWMGYERKRGKLGALNTFLKHGDRKEFAMIAGNTLALQNTKYVITLDTDTQLPRDAAWKMIATMAHPLNRPVCSDNKKIITEGYGILQPRVGINMPGIDSSRYLRLYANDTGVDPYTKFTSDVYQDMFREGSFIGKGIYEIDSFEKVLENRFPENRILSHDLIEGCYIRSGLISDVQLYEDNPGKFSTDVNRRHRWIRGDWQIAWWAMPMVPDANRKLYKNPLSALSRWKIFDNLRRSLVPFALMLLVVAGLALGAHPIFWAITVASILALPSLLASTLSLVRKPKDVMLSLHIISSLASIRDGLLQAGFTLACLPFEAYYTTDAIIRTAWRMIITNRKLLQWKPSGSLEQSNDNTISNAYKAMWINPFIAIVFGVYLAIYHHASFFTAVPLLLLWIAAPAMTWWVSRRAIKIKKDLSADQLIYLQKISRKTWDYFETFVNEQNNWLPPDNFQEQPKPVIAHRTSPTNIGLALLSNLSAFDFGYICTETLLTRTGNTLNTMSMLERHNKHFYNWYDTISLLPLPPRYISAVDSGNLAGHLLVVKQGLLEIPNKKIITKRAFEGLRDTLNVLEEYIGDKAGLLSELRSVLDNMLSEPLNSLSKAYEDVTRCIAHAQKILSTFVHEDNQDGVIWAHKLINHCNGIHNDIQTVAPWYSDSHQIIPPSLQDRIPTLQQIADCENVTAAEKAKERIATIIQFAAECELYADIEYEFLYDKAKHLLAIGYNVDEAKKDSGNYDLLASEARLSSFVAIAQNKIPQQSWFALGRSVTENEGSLLLLSWSGSMFEYLMPLLVMPTYEQTLLHQTYKSIVEKQIAYGQKRGVPWGISESGYNAVDANHNYQYKAFGVPGTGLKRGLVDDLVIAPYASVMALMVMPGEACQNLTELSRLGFEGRYGFYEAIDYTPSRIPRGQSHALIKSFMVHHQGMSLLSLSYLLHDQPMQKRFEAELRFQATLLLLQEKMTKVAASITHTLDITEIKTVITEQEMRHINTPYTAIPEVQLLSNGNYNVMISNAGGGYSKWRDIAVTRWREDTTRDNWGTFCYIKDVEQGNIWSNTHQPTNVIAKSYEAIFTQGRAEFKRFDNQIETLTEMVISPEDDVELRRIKVINRSRRQRTLEVTSYCEVVLNVQAADEIHPAFSNLFVQTKLQPDRKAIMCTRRPRSAGQQLPWMCHVMKLRGIDAEEISYETSRADFIGRGNTIENPAAVMTNGKMQNNEGSVLDPIASIKYKIVLEPGAVATFDMINGVGDTQDICQALIDKYQDKSHTERVLELAWTHSQVVLRQINATEADAQLYGRLASSIIYMNPLLRADEAVIRENSKGQSGLWGYSISGDLPIVLLKIKENTSIDLVKQMVQAHAYWRMKGLLVDLVIWNEEYGGYRQNMQEQISGLVSAAVGNNYGDKTGSIFLRQGDQIGKEDRILFETVARIIISDDKGSLADQVNRKAKPRLLPVYIETDEPAQPALTAVLKPDTTLDFYNGIGGFSADGKDYIIHTLPGKKTPAPWANVIANPSFGTIISESGQSYTWIDNAHEQRLTPWHNDPVCDHGGEQIYLRDEETGYVWSPTPLPVNNENTPAYITKHGFGYSVFLHNNNGIKSELWVFVDIKTSIKFSVLKLTNASGRMRRISATGYIEWVLGDRRTKSAMHIVTEKDENEIIYARNAYDTELNNKVAFFDTDQQGQRTYTCDRGEFIGRNGSIQSPEAMLRRGLSNKTGAGIDACTAIQISFDLADEEDKEIVFRLGIANNIEEAASIANNYKGIERAWTSLDEAKAYWADTLSIIEVESPDKALNILANGWLMYQTLTCRFWARSGYYQSGGAYGFRDQLQDALTLMYSKPELSKQQILLCATRQFEQGDVQHWWHPPTGRGVRTTCSDDYLWLPFVTAKYIEYTGDSSVLNESLGFINGRPLNEHEESYYDMPLQSDKKASLYEHCVLAINNGLRFGVHGLPLIGSGDWNDGMDKVGEKGNGESVWLGFFLYDVLTCFNKIAIAYKDDEFAAKCDKEAQQLKENINKNAWDGEWYRRAYFDDGTPLGSSENEECSIDSISQSWSVISGAGKKDYSLKGMQQLYNRLVDKENNLIQLLDPPFDKSSLDPGYIKGYVPGVRENGGQYSHAAIWSVMAFAAIGDNERTWELLNMINPINHGSTEAGMNKYKVEPYVMAADVYKVPSHLGRGGWTWYTGSAGWMYQCIISSFLGIRRNGDTLSFNPCLPAAWDDCNVKYRFRDTTYHISIKGSIDAEKETVVSMDGREQQEHVIHLKNDLQEHRIEIRPKAYVISQ